MKTHIVRYDAHYEVGFSRPAFGRIASFSQIIERIYDTFRPEMHIPSDAIKLENGNTISTAGVTLSLFSGLSSFEAKLDGYKAHFLDLRSPEAIDRAKRHAKLFEVAVCGFLIDAVPAHWRLVTPSWLTVDGGMDAAERLVRSLSWLPESHDPFGIGATKISSQVKFDCLNPDEQWAIGIILEKSALPDAHLFFEISAAYTPGTVHNTFDAMTEHLSCASKLVIEKLGLKLE